MQMTKIVIHISNQEWKKKILIWDRHSVISWDDIFIYFQTLSLKFDDKKVLNHVEISSKMQMSFLVLEITCIFCINLLS